MIQYVDQEATYQGETLPYKPTFFNEQLYKDYLALNIADFKFINQTAKHELVEIPMHLVNNIEVLLREIKVLKTAIALMTPADGILIETHQYPKWNTYEEFCKLPLYKYFESADRSESKIREQFAGESIIINRLSNDTQIISRPTVRFAALVAKNANIYQQVKHCIFAHDIIYDGPGCINYPSRDLELAGEDKKYYLNEYDECDDPDIFSRCITLYNYNNTLAKPLVLYVSKFLIGWFLHNWKQYAGDIYAVIKVGMSASFEIYRSAKKLMRYEDNRLIINLPTIRAVIINDVQYC